MLVLIRIPKETAISAIAELALLGFEHDVEFGFLPEEALSTVLVRGTLPPAAVPVAETIDGVTVFNDGNLGTSN